MTSGQTPKIFWPEGCRAAVPNLFIERAKFLNKKALRAKKGP